MGPCVWMGVLMWVFFQVYYCWKTEELVYDGCKCFPAHSLFWLYLCCYLTCWQLGVWIWQYFFHWQTLLKRLNSFISLLTFLPLELYLGVCIVVAETIWFMGRPWGQLLRQHDWEGNKWSWEISKPVVMQVCRVVPELFQIILTLKREKVGGKKIIFY